MGEAGPRSVLDYGLDDFTHLAPSSFDDRRLMARQIREAIDAFEPRLKVRSLSVEMMEGRHRCLEVRVEAWLLLEKTRVPVSFRTVMNTSEGTAEVYGS